MAKPRLCPLCGIGLIKNSQAKRCWDCYNTKLRKELQYNVSIHSGKGELHPRWKGGKWIYWRKQALIRDDYTCRTCGLRDIEIMDVDHIDPKRDSTGRFKLENHDINNLQTLCPNCHKRKSIQEAKFHSAHSKPR
jgi:hypothetical protein